MSLRGSRQADEAIPPLTGGGDCFAPLLRNYLRFLRKEGRLSAVELLAMTLSDCLCMRLLSFFSGLNNEYPKEMSD